MKRIFTLVIVRDTSVLGSITSKNASCKRYYGKDDFLKLEQGKFK